MEPMKLLLHLHAKFHCTSACQTTVQAFFGGGGDDGSAATLGSEDAKCCSHQRWQFRRRPHKTRQHHLLRGIAALSSPGDKGTPKLVSL